MPFPSSPTNGQTAVLNGITYQYSSTSNSWTRVGVTGAVSSATQVQTVLQTSNSSYFLTFVDSNNTAATAETVYTTSSFVINPSTGNIGIGTSSPGAKLDVNAGGIALAARIQGTNSPYLSVLDNDNTVEALVAADGILGLSIYGSITNHGIQFRTNNTEKMRIDSSGNVGIGTSTISGSLLEVHGNIRGLSLGIGTTASGVTGEIRATNEITAYFSSDARLKENVVEIKNAIEKLNQIRGVYFDWTKEYIDQRGGEDGYFVRKHDVGLIAQEVEMVLPEVVATRGDGYKAIKYEKVVALLVSAVKEQQQQITQLQDTINKLSTK